MKKWLAIPFLLLTTFVCGLCFYLLRNRVHECKTKIDGNSFFVPVPIEKYSETQAPCVNVKIEDKDFSVKIDLGFHGCLSLYTRIFDQISEKNLVGSTERWGFRGKCHSYAIYSIPQFKIGDGIFQANVLQEEEGVYKEAIVGNNKEENFIPEEGKLGWETFKLFNLLLDCQNEMIAFCNSTQMLKKQGYSIDRWAKVPLILDNGFVEFYVETENGPLRCVLDTGCTLNILNSDIKGDEDDLVLDPKYQILYPSFKVGKFDFGPVVFRPLPINMPVHVEAFLGMEFIKQHAIFIDFKNRMIYISPKSPFDSCRKFLTSLLPKF